MGYELVNFCELDKYAEKAYCAVHGVDPSLNLGDITLVDEHDLPQYDMICGGSPCFPAGTLVETNYGEVPIEKIKVGDRVLTHKNRYMLVDRVGGRKSQEIYKLSICKGKSVYATDYHPFYVMHDKESTPEMTPLSDIKNGDYIAIPICLLPDAEFNDCFKRGEHLWIAVHSAETTGMVEDVYNLEVREDHTYTANGVVVSNCQDFSVAGKQAGSKWKCQDCEHEYNPITVHYDVRHKCPECGSENLNKTRSSLLVEWLRVVRENHPKWCVYENVKNIVGKKFKDTFDLFIQELSEYGYNTYYQVLNAKNYGIPQNRERVYVICIQKELDNGKFKFPEGFDNGLRLKDMLEDEVEEKFYINNERAQTLIDDLIASGKLDKEISNSVRGGGGKHLIDKKENDAKYRIRKLTPKECWRLMGFKDEDFEEAQFAGISNSQLYKMAGNSIVVDVLYYIYKELHTAMPYLFDDLKVGSFFSGIGAFEKGLDRLYAEL